MPTSSNGRFLQNRFILLPLLRLLPHNILEQFLIARLHSRHFHLICVFIRLNIHLRLMRMLNGFMLRRLGFFLISPINFTRRIRARPIFRHPNLTSTLFRLIHHCRFFHIMDLRLSITQFARGCRSFHVRIVSSSYNGN